MTESKISGNVYNLSVARLYTLKRKLKLIYYDPGNDEFICVAAAAVLAFDMLRSKTGRINLESNGRDIVTEYLAEAKIMNGSLDILLMSEYVNDFLEKIRENFPYVVLQDLVWSRGRTTKETWGQEKEDEYSPKNAAVIELNIRVSRLTSRLYVYLTE